MVVSSVSGRIDRTLCRHSATLSAYARSEGVYSVARRLRSPTGKGDNNMNNIIYLIGLVVVVVAILGFFGLR
jgi:hypothetical protein